MTDRHRLKYLELLGVKPEKAKAAHVDISFSSTRKTELIKGTQVSTEVAGKKISFSLDEDLVIVPTAFGLEKLIVDGLTEGVFDRTRANEAGDLFFAPFGEQVRAGCAFYLGFGKDNDIPPQTLSFMCYLYEKDLKAPGSHGNEQEYGFENAKLKWEISGTAGGYPWREVKPIDNTAGFKKSGRITFRELEGWKATKSMTLMNFENSYFWLRCTVKESGYEYPPRVEKIRLNTVQATQNLAAGKGTEREGKEERKEDREKGKENGEEGNLKAGCIWKVEGAEHLEIINYMPAAGGRKAQTIDEAVEDFLRDFKVPYTAVTNSDYEYIALNTPGLRVAKAKAVPNYRPLSSRQAKYGGTEPTKSEYSKGCVTVAVIPYTPLEILRSPPAPSEGFIQAVCRHLDRHRLLGTEIHVISPDYIKVTVNVTVVPQEGYLDDSLVRKNVLSALNRYIHPVKGGLDEQGWPVGRDVYLSELYELMETIAGVKCIIRLSVSGGPGSYADSNGNLVLGSKFSSVYAGEHNVEITRETESCLKRGGLHS